MRVLVITLNLLALLVIGFLLVENGFPSQSEEVLLVIAFVASPVVTLAYLLGNGGRYEGESRAYDLKKQIEIKELELKLAELDRTPQLSENKS